MGIKYLKGVSHILLLLFLLGHVQPMFSFLCEKICDSFRVLVADLTWSEELFEDRLHVLAGDGVRREEKQKIWYFREIFMRCDASTNYPDRVKSVKVIVENHC